MDDEVGGARHHVRLVLTYDLLVDERGLCRALDRDELSADGVSGLVDVLAAGLPAPQWPAVAVLQTRHETTFLDVVGPGQDLGAVAVGDDRGGWGPVLRRLARGLLSWD